MENETLATELLHEVKANGKRWFRAFLIMVVLEIATILGFIWYISLPIEEYTIEQESDNASRNFVIGGDNYGGKTESELQTESNKK